MNTTQHNTSSLNMTEEYISLRKTALYMLHVSLQKCTKSKVHIAEPTAGMWIMIVAHLHSGQPSWSKCFFVFFFARQWCCVFSFRGTRGLILGPNLLLLATVRLMCVLHWSSLTHLALPARGMSLANGWDRTDKILSRNEPFLLRLLWLLLVLLLLLPLLLLPAVSPQCLSSFHSHHLQ